MNVLSLLLPCVLTKFIKLPSSGTGEEALFLSLINLQPTWKQGQDVTRNAFIT